MGASKFKDMVKDDAEAKQNADKLLNKQVVCGLLTGQVCTIKIAITSKRNRLKVKWFCYWEFEIESHYNFILFSPKCSTLSTTSTAHPKYRLITPEAVDSETEILYNFACPTLPKLPYISFLFSECRSCFRRWDSVKVWRMTQFSDQNLNRMIIEVKSQVNSKKVDNRS